MPEGRLELSLYRALIVLFCNMKRGAQEIDQRVVGEPATVGQAAAFEEREVLAGELFSELVQQT